ncbi:hypothetical protein FN846DRAFT_700295 [Sphaerosporella brunnea]|uniref:Actin cytoskeleton-regulatory complex protein SLA1 n=1 Tax=Sphaerosporella brunnea TaxID=1250544 RepID=A0A5J5EXP3_9PEZI|nr:hypothetical protein FN846DRAFT_700295 [Sphaerosporella brunnea]
MASPFLGVYTAVYGYTAQNSNEINFEEGDLLCILEKPADDDWWKAKKKGNSVEDEEPVGLIPNNYVKEAKPTATYKALYDYTAQTEEELSFHEDDSLEVYDVSDPDWALGGLGGRYGYIPANYIEKAEGSPSSVAETRAAAPVVAAAAPVKKHVGFAEEPTSPPSPESPVVAHRPEPSRYEAPASPPLPERTPAEASAPRRAIPAHAPSAPSPTTPQFRPESTYSRDDHHREHSRDHGRPAPNRGSKSPKSPQYDDSDDSDGPGLPLRRPGQPPYSHGEHRSSSPPIPPGFRTYAVMEVDSKKKRAAILGLGPNRVILLPDKSTRPKEEWTVDNLTGYNHEGKHVFLDLKHPSRSLDLHAGSTQNAEEIISALGELRGLRKASGLDEVLAAAKMGADSAKNTDIGTVLYDFVAQGEDEVSVTAGDEVLIIDANNDEWWLVRRQVNGAEGVLPSSYVERGRKNILPGAGIKESPANRSEARKSQHVQSSSRGGDVATSSVPERRSSLAGLPQSRKSAPAKSKPDAAQIRTWTDRTGSFKVEAQFLGCKDGKIHLHKVNGVKIAVPVSKMSMSDLKYVEDRTGISLDEDKPLSEIMKQQRKQQPTQQAGIVVDRIAGGRPNAGFAPSKQSDYDWFEFFLSCGVEVHNCQRYAISFQKDEMDESSLEYLTPDSMRALGVKEGDILRIMKKLDERYDRIRKKSSTDGDGKSLFTDEQGNLKASRTRPPPAVQTGAVDAKALQTQKDNNLQTNPAPKPAQTPQSGSSGFDDDAWAPKPTKAETAPQPSPPPAAPAPAQPPQQQAPPVAQPTPLPPTGALGELAALSLDTPPLQPTVKTPPPLSFVPPSTPMYQPPAQQPQPVFTSASQVPSIMASTFTGAPMGQPAATYTAGRARPMAPAITGNLGIAPPPPARPLSAPQTFAQGQSQPMAPNFTGVPNHMQYGGMVTMQSQGSIPNMMGGTGGMVPQLSYQNTGMPAGQFANGGFAQLGFQTPMQPQMPGVPPPLTGIQQAPAQFPMFTGAQPNAVGVNRGLPPPLIPQLTAAPLQPQPTGPPPPVRFGVQKKLTPQPTGRANLTKATPDNPFGF